MSKIYRLRNWLTLGEAAKHLSGIVDEEVSEADLLRMALDGHLTLSVNFVNHAQVRRGRKVAKNEAKTITGIDGEQVVCGIALNASEVLQLDEGISRIQGIWDLPMFGAERLDIEHKFQKLTEGPDVTLVCLEGAFVAGPDGVPHQLQAVDLRPGKRVSRDFFYPAGSLPDDCSIVVRTAALTELQGVLLSGDASKAAPSTDLAESEKVRASLQKQVAALSLLLAEKSKLYKIGDRPNASQIAAGVAEILDSLEDANRYGLGASSISASIKAGIELLNK